MCLIFLRCRVKIKNKRYRTRFYIFFYCRRELLPEGFILFTTSKFSETFRVSIRLIRTLERIPGVRPTRDFGRCHGHNYAIPLSNYFIEIIFDGIFLLFYFTLRFSFNDRGQPVVLSTLKCIESPCTPRTTVVVSHNIIHSHTVRSLFIIKYRLVR